MKLAGRVALVSAGSKGIGRAIALRLAADGADIAISFAHDEAAAASWYDTIYLPIIAVIRSQGLLHDFPGRTEADMYTWIARHRASPSAASRVVDSAMSENMTVVRIRSTSIPGRSPVRNSATSSATRSIDGVIPMSPPSSSTRRAPGMWSAR